jgi:hypothetical protein
MKPAEFTYETRKTRRGASYGGYTEMHNEKWAVCWCGAEFQPSHSTLPNSHLETALIRHRLDHLEGRV